MLYDSSARTVRQKADCHPNAWFLHLIPPPSGGEEFSQRSSLRNTHSSSRRSSCCHFRSLFYNGGLRSARPRWVGFAKFGVDSTALYIRKQSRLTELAATGLQAHATGLLTGACYAWRLQPTLRGDGKERPAMVVSRVGALTALCRHAQAREAKRDI